MVAVQILGVMLLFLFIGVPIGFALWFAGLFAVLVFRLSSLTQVAQSLYSTLDNFVLLAIPFFILAGNIIVRGNVATPLFQLIQSSTRRLPAGAAIGTSLGCAAFGAMTGSSVAAAAALARTTTQELKRLGYDAGFISGMLAAGGTLAILIPPSVSLVIYGSLAKISVGSLFIAAVIPGILMAAALTTTTWIVATRRYGVENRLEPASREELMRQALMALPAIGIPVIILGGIFSGLFSPTEAAAVASLYAGALVCFVFRNVGLRDLSEVFIDSAKSTATILFIVSGAIFIGHVCTLAGLPNDVIALLEAYDLSWWEFLMLVNVMLLVLGFFLDGFTLTTVVTPLMLPSVLAAGVDPFHFAIVLVVNIEIAAITPPIGLNLFVISSVSDVPVGDVARGVLPFLVVLVVMLILFTFVPEISLFTLK
ncbi:MAG: TRAP transporter large permease [Rhizobiaceae bacterium]